MKQADNEFAVKDKLSPVWFAHKGKLYPVWVCCHW